MFSLRRDRDYAMLAIVSFLMVLASAVLTVDSVFLLFFAGFMLMAVATFILMEMRLSGRAADLSGATPPRYARAPSFRVLACAGNSGFGADDLLGAAAMFFLLPRMSAGYLGAYSFGTDLSTGFSERVQLGGIGQIQQSDAVVMHIQIDGDRHGQYALHWRSVSLAIFNGTDWSNPPGRDVLFRQRDGAFSIPWSSQGVADDDGSESIVSGPAQSLYSLPRADGADRYQRFLSRSVGTPSEWSVSRIGNRFGRSDLRS